MHVKKTLSVKKCLVFKCSLCVKKKKKKKKKKNTIDFEEPNSIFEQFNKFFVEIRQEIANDANSKTSNDNFRTYLTKSVNSTIVFDPPNSLEIYNAINALNPHKACGYDDISAAFLRLGNEVLAPFLTAYDTSKSFLSLFFSSNF